MQNTKITQTAWWVVLNKKWQVLVVSQNGNSWSLPKWHIDPWENALEAARREIYEEAWVVDLILIKELWSYKRYKIWLDWNDDMSELKEIFMFLFTTLQYKLSPVDKNNPVAIWTNKEDVGQLLTHKKDKAFFMSVIDIV